MSLVASIAAGWTWIVWIHVSPHKATMWVADRSREGVRIGVECVVVGCIPFAWTGMSM